MNTRHRLRKYQFIEIVELLKLLISQMDSLSSSDIVPTKSPYKIFFLSLKFHLLNQSFFQRSYYELINSLHYKECNEALIRIKPRINMTNVEKMID